MHSEIEAALERFSKDLAEDSKGAAPFVALQELTRRVVGAKLFTTLSVDVKNGVYRREYTSNPTAYPVSGTKPIDYNRWYDIVCKQRQIFVANSIGEISTLFRDHATISSLGYGSVVNFPVVLGGELLGTVNCTDVEGHYTPDRVALLKHLAIPAQFAFILTKVPDAA